MSAPPAHWRPTLAALALVLVMIAYFFSNTLGAMAGIWWRSGTYAHGLVVPPLVLWLIWRKRQQLAAFHPTAAPVLLFPLLLCTFAWLLAELVAVNVVAQFSVVALIVLAVAALLGWKISKELAFPLFFLFFSVPFGDFLMPRLMEWTADFTVLAIRASGIPVYREGQDFVIPSGHWSVVEACSGIRYLVASLTVGTLYAYLTYSSIKRRVLFILVSIAVPIVANWLRAYMIVMLGHLSGNQLAVGVDHLIYGWLFFGVVIILMFALGSRWAERPAETRGESSPRLATPRPASSPWRVAAALVPMIAAAPVVAHQLNDVAPSAALALEAPAPAHGWQFDPRGLAWQPAYVGPSAHLATAYRKDQHRVSLDVLYYRHQNHERKLVTSTNTLAHSTDPGWQAQGVRDHAASADDALPAIRESLLISKRDDSRYVVWQWYWVNGRLTRSDLVAKGLTAMNRLLGRGDDSAAIILVTPQPEAVQSLPEFCRDMLTSINRSLHKARSS